MFSRGEDHKSFLLSWWVGFCYVKRQACKMYPSRESVWTFRWYKILKAMLCSNYQMASLMWLIEGYNHLLIPKAGKKKCSHPVGILHKLFNVTDFSSRVILVLGKIGRVGVASLANFRSWITWKFEIESLCEGGSIAVEKFLGGFSLFVLIEVYHVDLEFIVYSNHDFFLFSK